MRTVGSMFAGIGGFDLGFERAGFRVAWCIEKDKRAQDVLRARFPGAIVYGDITEVDADTLEKVDVICGGFPCQDLSVAGKRAGLKGGRSGLFFDAMRIVRRLSPRLLVLENVPGLLSSNRGLDFAAVIREVGEGWDCQEVAWRVLDSQFFGVAQRRRRCFIVASAREGDASALLALDEGVPGDPPPRRAQGEDAASDAAGGSGVRGTWWDGSDRAASLTTRCHDQFMPDKANFAAVVIDRAAYNQGENALYNPLIEERDVMPSLVARGPHAVAFRKSKRARSPTDDETWVEDGVANTLNRFDQGDTRTTHAVAIDLFNQTETGDVHVPLRTAQGHGAPAVMSNMVVRRLTPVECERLQGFPDGWTDIDSKKPTPDSRRYKQLGNAVTVNVAEWLARRAMSILNGGDA